MKSYLGPSDIANSIRMMRSLHRGSFLIVEGDTDCRVYGRFVDREKCYVVIASNKTSAIQALRILEGESFPGVLAIVDCDFYRLEEPVASSPNLLTTDGHDLECLIIASPALEKVLAEYGSTRKLAEKNARDILIRNGKMIGLLRWISQKECIGLKFEGLKFSDFVDRDTLQVDVLLLIKAVKNQSQLHHLMDSYLEGKLVSLQDKYDEWDVCCGHDLVQILSIGLRKAFGSCKAIDVAPEKIETVLRLAYEFAHFRMSLIFSAMRNWEQRNSPFVVLFNEPG